MNIIEKDKTLSESCIWQMHYQFYQEHGISAWQGKIPYYVTSNPFTADQYAEAIRALVSDWRRDQPEQSRFIILELGAGCGQFSFYLLRLIADLPIQYVMSDFNQAIIDYWRTQVNLKPYQELGLLSFAQYNLVTDEVLPLQSEQPMIVIANYVFDSIPSDLLTVDDGQCFQNYVKVQCDDDNLKDGIIKDFDKITLDYTRAVDALDYANDDWNQLLAQYQEQLIDTHFLFPVAALKVLATIDRCATSGAVIMATDKAYTLIEQLDQLDYPELSGHYGCFSTMANFEALAKYCELHQGSALMQSDRPGVLTALFSLRLDLREQPVFASLQRFIQHVSAADYLNLYRNMLREHDDWELDTIVSFLALSCWDPHCFERVLKRLLSLLDGANVLTVSNLVNHMSDIADKFYQIPGGYDVLFAIAVFFHTLKHYDDAIVYYERSMQYVKPNFSVFFNIGVCYYYLGRPEFSQEYFKKAQQLTPDDDKVNDWLTRINAA